MEAVHSEADKTELHVLKDEPTSYVLDMDIHSAHCEVVALFELAD